MQIRDRVIELKRIKGSAIRPDPRNWRTHPQAQQDALRGVLAEVGIAGALLVRKLADGGYMLIDGHMRADVSGETEWPCLILDVDESEAAKLLATVDPIAAMAETNANQLDALLRQVETGNEALQEMLAALADKAGLYMELDDVQPPEDFDEKDETIDVEHTCPKCGYQWSGGE